MIEGFLLDGVDMDGYGTSVDEAAQFSVYVHARPAPSPITGFDNTAVGAKEAFHNVFLMNMVLPMNSIPVAMTGHALGAR
jgi:hypothetical protein